jgi:hypothetical protein
MNARRPPATIETTAPLPTGSAGDGLLYLYCVQLTGADPLRRHAGLEDLPLSLVDVPPLRAVVSVLTLGDDAESLLQERVNDMGWLAVNAQAHDAVIQDAFAAGPVLPVRFATIFQSRSALEDLLKAHSAEWAAELEGLRGSSEWGVKLLVDPSVLRNAVVSTGEQEERSGGPGALYLAARQAERALAERVRDRSVEIARLCDERLALVSMAAVPRDIPSPAISGESLEIITSAAYLVRDAEAEGFRRTVDELRRELMAWGCDVRLTGPHPPHHFSSMGSTGRRQEES